MLGDRHGLYLCRFRTQEPKFELLSGAPRPLYVLDSGDWRRSVSVLREGEKRQREGGGLPSPAYQPS